ncbi:MAG: hypothetical protein BWK74_00755 [Desulfobacteraceae bacterium A6]|nr:MAG: hypothetical protein BWK74_00755 [Desulfobacteraceae bacterium A6]
MSYKHLSENERYVIGHLAIAEFSIREIARRLNRHHSTISRELRRNDDPLYEDNIYWHDWTNPGALKRRHKARHHRRNSNQAIVNYVKRKLKEDWSPEIISQKLKAGYPGDDKMRVSHETIYRWIYSDANDGGTLYNHLRRRRKKRHDLTAWVASAGIIGLALSFAAKDTLANLFSGVFILADAPYKIGDFIVLDSGERGEVTNIGIRSTRLLTRSDIEITVPNSIMGNTRIINEAGGRHQKFVYQ